MTKVGEKTLQTKKQREGSKAFCGYPMMYETISYYTALDDVASQVGKRMAVKFREMVWDYIEDPYFNHKEFIRLRCDAQMRGPKTGKDRGRELREHAISAFPDARLVVEKFEALANKYGVTKSSLLRYVLRSRLS